MYARTLDCVTIRVGLTQRRPERVKVTTTPDSFGLTIKREWPLKGYYLCCSRSEGGMGLNGYVAITARE